ncbi:hypothetical protein ACSG3M_004185 [Vibrio vulnificus]|uniref:hypothetical protein n=1 Tax=Vibrio TaxID=662 RepID=UPI000A3CF368|nr:MULTISPECIES: hypothetical protein [Vibrio]EGQ9284070.1 hypothetical protein [Vibrio vulnificus]EGR2758363.1 hypothetical protein [Vibrio parahaemolyticus]EHK9068763.1 hypothetical protein [Vibrio vulnificus]EHP3974521.1 hypothetical protein [Vibrio parahaemolyticus]EHU4802169.1 hypothetical protein [Vibrio vulnificus]
MDWWQTLLVTISTFVVTKLVDHFIAISKEKRELSKARKSKKIDQIENLMDEVSVYYEVTMSWKHHEMKQEYYRKLMKDDDYLIGKYNRYKGIASHARDVLHHCKIIASEENPETSTARADLSKLKDELAQKYDMFIKACEEEIESTV